MSGGIVGGSPSEQTEDHLTADETTTSLTYVASGISVTVSNNSLKGIAVCAICSDNTNASQNVYRINGTDNNMQGMAHNSVANHNVDMPIIGMLTQTGQAVSLSKHTSIGTMTTLGTAPSITSMEIFAVG